MSGWLRFENSTAENPKLAPLSDRAFRLWFNACCYCSRNETNGIVPRSLAVSLSSSATRRTVEELVVAGRFEVVDDAHYYIHDYLEHNPSKERLLEMRRAAADRVSRWRERNGDGRDNALETSSSRTRGPRDRSVDVDVPLSSSTEQLQGSGIQREREADKHPEAAGLSRLLADLVLQRDPRARVSPESDGWVREMRLLVGDRGGDVVLVERILRWSQADAFWQGVVLSPKKLRLQFTQLLLKSQRPGGGAGGRRENASDMLRALDGVA